MFEPGPNNLPYIQKNTESITCIYLVKKAVTNYTGTAKFYIENLTGQNNSLLEDYHVLKENMENAGIYSNQQTIVDVPCITLANFLFQGQLSLPAFIKIDVEGNELNVLNGMKSILAENDSVLMVEVTENAQDILTLLIDIGFQVFSPKKKPLVDLADIKNNIFCVKGNNDRSKIFTS